MTTAYDRLVDELRGRGHTVNVNGTRTMAQCPAHDDSNPSLSITPRGDRVLIHCFAGCSTDDVVKALGWTAADLFNNRTGADYIYPDGRIVHRRYGEDGRKSFRQSGNTSGCPQLYRLDAVRKAVSAGKPVYLVEGEEDVHTLESLGVTATTAPMGADNFAKVDVSPLEGAHVVVIVDRDGAGKRWAAKVRKRLHGYAKTLDFRQAKSGKDATDHVAAGHGLNDFEQCPEPEAGKPEPEPEAWNPEPERRITLVKASAIAPRPVHWLWSGKTPHEGRIPAGMLILIAGREGTGKSSVVYTLAAQITRGTLPGIYYGTPKSVIVAAYEDSWAHTIIPRLMAAGANLDRVFRADVTTVDGAPGNMSLPRDVAGLRDAIMAEDVALVVLDPFMSALDARMKSNEYQSVYQALLPIARLADETRCAFIGITHFNKTTGADPMARIMGSAAFAGVVRGALIVHKVKPGEEITLAVPEGKSSPPELPEGPLYLLGHEKNNVGRMMPTLVYSLSGVKVAETEEGDVWAPVVTWHGETDETVSARMEDEERSKKQRETKSGRASEWLKAELGDMKWHRSADIYMKGEKAGFKTRTLQRALSEIGARKARTGLNTTWWTLNPDLDEPDDSPFVKEGESP